MDKNLRDFLDIIRRTVFDGELTHDGVSEESIRLAREQDVGCLLGRTVNGADNPLYYQAAYRGIARESFIAEVTALLEECGIDYILLKGAWIKDLYPEPALRTSSDIDILVREDSVDRAAEQLCARLGFRAAVKGFHCIPLYREPTCLELHYRLDVGNSHMDPTLGRAWEYAVPQSGHRYVFTPEFALFHSVSHTANHLRAGGCGVRALLDLRLMTDRLAWDEEGLRALLREAQLERFYDVCRELIDAWFGPEGVSETPLSPTAERTGEFILSHKLMGTAESNVVFRRSDRYANSASARVAEGERLGRVGYLLRRVFTTRSYLESLYPQLMGKPGILVPWYQMKRWSRMLDRRTRRRTLHEARINWRLDPDKIRQTESLLEELSL